jgi:hypothetical protein
MICCLTRNDALRNMIMMLLVIANRQLAVCPFFQLDGESALVPMDHALISKMHTFKVVRSIRVPCLCCTAGLAERTGMGSRWTKSSSQRLAHQLGEATIVRLRTRGWSSSARPCWFYTSSVQRTGVRALFVARQAPRHVGGRQ